MRDELQLPIPTDGIIKEAKVWRSRVSCCYHCYYFFFLSSLPTEEGTLRRSKSSIPFTDTQSATKEFRERNRDFPSHRRVEKIVKNSKLRWSIRGEHENHDFRWWKDEKGVDHWSDRRYLRHFSFFSIYSALPLYLFSLQKKRREKGKKKTKITSEKQMLQEHTGYGKIRMILQCRKNSEYRKELKKKRKKSRRKER